MSDHRITIAAPGPQGPRGVPGPNTIPTVDAVETALTQPGPAGVLNAAIGGAQSGLSFAPVTDLATAAAGANPVPVESIGGYLYGAVGGTLSRALDTAGPWTQVVALGTGGTINGLREAGDGEVLMSRTQGGIWKSSGWATNPMTATWSQVLVTNEQVTPFSWDVDPGSGWVVVTCYTAAADMSNSRYVWLSKDHGATFVVIFDMAAAHPTLAMATSHLHHASLDPYWNAAAPRIWVSYHKTPNDPTEAADKLQRTIYTDAPGTTHAGTPWTVFSSEADSSHHPVIAIATPRGMVFDTDTDPVALYVVPRTASPAAMTHDTRQLLYLLRRDTSMHGWAARAVRGSGGSVHVGFRSSVAGYPGAVITTDGWRATETVLLPATTGTDLVDFLNLTVHRGKVVGTFMQTSSAPGAYRVFTATEPMRGAPASNDEGGLRGGIAESLGTATGLGAWAGLRGVANGVLAWAAERSTAVGRLARALTSLATTVGAESESGEQGTNVGALGKATGYQAVNVGTQGEASASGAINIGRNGKATHAQSVNIGQGGATTDIGQLQIGARHIELAASAPPIPGAGKARPYLRSVTVNGTARLQLAMRAPTGVILPIATEAAATAGAIRTGTGTLVAGSLTVADSSMTANTVIRVTSQTTAGDPGALYVGSRTAGTGFTVKSTSATDTSVVFWEVIQY